MDQQSYDQLHISSATVGDSSKYLLENQTAIVATHDGVPLYVELPASVELVITYTEPGLQGDRSTGGTKPATLETGCGDPGPAVRRAGHQGQGRHPRRFVPRPRELTHVRSQQGTQACPGHPLRCRAARSLPDRCPRGGARWVRVRRRASPPPTRTPRRSSRASSATSSASMSCWRRTRPDGHWTGCRRSTATSCASGSSSSCGAPTCPARS